MPTPPDDTARPADRHFIQWGRAPQTVFRVGPLPGQGPSARPPVDPVVARPPVSILSGSMIPQRRSATDRALPPVDARVEPRSDPTSLPVRASGATGEVGPEVPVFATSARPSSGRRWVYLAAGAIAASVVMISAAAWLFTRPAPAPDAPPPESAGAVSLSAAPEVPTPIVPVPDADPAPVVRATVPASPAGPARPAPEVRMRRPPVAEAEPLTPAAASPAPVGPPTSPPVIVAEPVVPPPTAAQPPSGDPEGPIITRPQPLDPAEPPVSE